MLITGSNHKVLTRYESQEIEWTKDKKGKDIQSLAKHNTEN